jgi:hypothetical protein
LLTEAPGGRELAAPERPYKVNERKELGSEPNPPLAEAAQARVNGITKNARELVKATDAYWGADKEGQIDISAADSMGAARESLQQQISCMGTDELRRLLPVINREMENDGMSLRFHDHGTNDVDVHWKASGNDSSVDVHRKDSSGNDSSYELGSFHRKSPNPGCFVS